jgi:3D (Asp-Asp-Asp) domain-containing protein
MKKRELMKKKKIERLTWLILYIMLISIICAINSLPVQMIDTSTTTNNDFIPYIEHYSMWGTAYTNHEDCINLKDLDGITATGTKAREGIVAINIDIDEDGKAKVRSVLKLGQTIYVKGQFIEGIFTV